MMFRSRVFPSYRRTEHPHTPETAENIREYGKTP
jgi:hypothetical protein